MRKIYIVVLLLLISAVNVIACCCEATIMLKTQALDSYLEQKNNTNKEALDKLLTKFKDLNKDIIADRNSNIDDTNLINSLAKNDIKNVKNLHHAITIPQGLQYYQMKKDEFYKDSLLAALSNQIDLNNIENRIMINSAKNNILLMSKSSSEITEKETKDFMGEKD